MLYRYIKHIVTLKAREKRILSNIFTNKKDASK
jgi:uncharacterized protein YktA (UPF0223 family)